MPPVFAHGRLRLYLLKLLDEAPRHGYEVIRLLEERFQGLYAPSAGTVYPRLAKLEAEGLVTHATEGGRKVYSITDAGRAELADRSGELADLELEIRESVSELAAEIRDDVRGAAGKLRSEMRAAAGETRHTSAAGTGAKGDRRIPFGDFGDFGDNEAWRTAKEELRKAKQEWKEQARRAKDESRRAREEAQQARRQAKEAQERAREEMQRSRRSRTGPGPLRPGRLAHRRTGRPGGDHRPPRRLRRDGQPAPVRQAGPGRRGPRMGQGHEPAPATRPATWTACWTASATTSATRPGTTASRRPS